MNRNKIRILSISMIILVLCIPLGIFMIQDYLQLNTTKVFSDNDQSHEIIRSHPLIATLYSSYYTNDVYPCYTPEYSIKNESYSTNEKEKIKELQSFFNEEINKMLKQNVIPYHLIELENNQEFKANFGYLRDFTNDIGGHCFLTQYFRIHTDNDVSATYQYNRSARKVLSVSIENKNIKDITQDDLKMIGWNMLCYLGLDDIHDWEYTDYSYTSKKAKLVVYCYKVKVATREYLDIGVELKDIFAYRRGVLIED